MKVLILNHYNRLSPRLQQEVKTLSDIGCSIDVLLWDRDQTVSPTIEGATAVERISLRAPKGTLTLLVFLPWAYVLIVKRLWRRPYNIVHCSHIMLLPLAVFLGRTYKAKVIYDVYEFHLQETTERLPRLLRWLAVLLRRLEARLVRSVDVLFTIDSAGNQLERYYKRYNNKIAVLYNVPDLHYPLDKKKVQHLRRRYRDKKIVLYIGGLSIAKGALRAIETAKLLVQKTPEAFFLFIGAFHGDTENAFWERVNANNLGNNVEFVSWLPYGEMIHYLALSKVGLALHQPISRYYLVSKGNGRKFFTYMQFGIPIVGPEFGEVGQVVREEQCGVLVDTTNPRQIADAIVYLLEHPDEANAMGEQGKKAVQEKYNWEIEKQKLLNVYQRLGCEINERKTKA